MRSDMQQRCEPGTLWFIVSILTLANKVHLHCDSFCQLHSLAVHLLWINHCTSEVTMTLLIRGELQ